MHDILEGSLQYEIKEWLKHFMHVEKYFSLDLLNNGIRDFPYVLFDTATIAPSVLASSDHSVKQKGQHFLKLIQLI